MYRDQGFPNNIPSLQGLRMLIVDNNIDSGNLMTMLLQPYGVEVRVAFLVQKALELFMQWQPDVLVSEIALPKEDGYALIRQVRTLTAARGKETLALAVTACANKETRQRTLSAGFDMWFTKPLNFDEFLAALSCLVICQQSTYAIAKRCCDSEAVATLGASAQIAQRILGNVLRHGELSLEHQLYSTFPS